MLSSIKNCMLEEGRRRERLEYYENRKMIAISRPKISRLLFLLSCTGCCGKRKRTLILQPDHCIEMEYWWYLHHKHTFLYLLIETIFGSGRDSNFFFIRERFWNFKMTHYVSNSSLDDWFQSFCWCHNVPADLVYGLLHVKRFFIRERFWNLKMRHYDSNSSLDH